MGADPVCRRPGYVRRRAAMVMTACAAVSAAALAGQGEPARDLARTVNTFIGTGDGGNTFPGADAPFGMIQVSPVGAYYSGWQYDDPTIRGFGHSFLSGAGCSGQGGQLAVLPVTGRIGSGGAFAAPGSFDYRKYAAHYTHAGEVGQAGYYRVHLTSYGGIDAEATALTRAAAERYRFAAGSREGTLLVNTGQADKDHTVVGSVLKIVGDRVIEGRITTHSFCGGQAYTTWFRMKFDRPFRAFGTLDADGAHPGNRRSGQDDGQPNGAWLTFDLGKDRAVTAISALSLVDAAGARLNLRAEGERDGHLLSFDAMRALAQGAWRRELGTVRIEAANADDATVFYTALYHALLQPLTASDADGRYRGYDTEVHRADGWTYYDYFSLWDTYRSQNQLLALLRPSRARDIARTMLAIQAQNGWLPRWGYADFDTNVMTGDPVTPWLTDLWRFGDLKGEEREAYAALRQNAFGVPPFASRSQGRAGNPNYLAHGFVQYDPAFSPKGMDSDPQHAASATLEYATADCALAQLAQAVGERADAQVLRARGGNWRKVWDPAVVDAPTGFRGFPRPRLADGGWFQDPGGGYSPRSQYGFHEGTAWQYQWLVQQDVPGLVAALGGRDSALRRLDTFFAYDELLKDPLHAASRSWVSGTYSYYDQYRYNPENEPDIQVPWMYALMGAPWKTSAVVRAAEALYTNAPGGITGNDDLGTMSAWYVFAALGFYPMEPGSGRFVLNAPRFRQAAITLESGRVLEIDAPRANAARLQYIDGVRLGGRPDPRVWLDFEQLNAGGRLEYRLTGTPPEHGWGTSSADLPPALCPTDSRGAGATR